MSSSASPDHDQRLKVLLKEFFEQFFRCFFSAWAERFDFSELTWIDKEVFLAPPQGEKRQLDLVARIRIRPGAPPPTASCSDLLALVHIEVESRESVQPLRPRMFEYYVQLRRDSQLPVLPVGLFLRVGLDGIGWDSYEEFFWDHRLLRFEYAYVGLPALDGEAYATGEHVLGAALSALMRVPPERRAEVYAEALKRIAGSGENDWRRFLLAECADAYADLDTEQRERLQTLLTTENFQEARSLMITTYERGILQGKLEGKLEEQRRIALRQLAAKFGPLSETITQRVQALSSEELDQLALHILTGASLKDLHLQD